MHSDGFGDVIGYDMDGAPIDKFGNVVEVTHRETCQCQVCRDARARREAQYRKAHAFASNGASERGMQEARERAQPPNTHLPRSLDVGAGPFKALAFRRSKRDPVMQRCAFCGDDIIGNRAMTHLQAGQCMIGQVCATDKCTQGVIRVLMEALPHQSIVLVDKDGVEVRLPK